MLIKFILGVLYDREPNDDATTTTIINTRTEQGSRRRRVSSPVYYLSFIITCTNDYFINRLHYAYHIKTRHNKWIWKKTQETEYVSWAIGKWFFPFLFLFLFTNYFFNPSVFVLQSGWLPHHKNGPGDVDISDLEVFFFHFFSSFFIQINQLLFYNTETQHPMSPTHSAATTPLTGWRHRYIFLYIFGYIQRRRMAPTHPCHHYHQHQDYGAREVMRHEL